MSGTTRFFCILFIAASGLTGCNSPKSSPLNPKEKAKKGEVLFNSVGCTMCHSVTGEAKYGPSLNGIVNTSIQVIHEGSEHSLIVDREYILRSIQNPEYEKLISFKTKKMPKTELAPEEIEFITDYLISINEN
jgi:hypothetical protein